MIEKLLVRCMVAGSIALLAAMLYDVLTHVAQTFPAS